MYALCDLLYWHKQLRFNSWRILLHSLGDCDKGSMSIILCLVLSKFAIGSVLMSSLGVFFVRVPLSWNCFLNVICVH